MDRWIVRSFDIILPNDIWAGDEILLPVDEGSLV